MSDYEMPQEVPPDDEKRRGFFGSWYVRITLGVIGLILLVIIVIVIAYQQAKSSHGKPLEIDHYPGMQQMSDRPIQPGQSRQLYQLEVESLELSEVLDEVEAHYQRQMDECSRLSEDTIVCEKDRSSDRFNFVQLSKLTIQVSDPSVGLGYVVVEVINYWEE